MKALTVPMSLLLFAITASVQAAPCMIKGADRPGLSTTAWILYIDGQAKYSSYDYEKLETLRDELVQQGTCDELQFWPPKN